MASTTVIQARLRRMGLLGFLVLPLLSGCGGDPIVTTDTPTDEEATVTPSPSAGTFSPTPTEGPVTPVTPTAAPVTPTEAPVTPTEAPVTPTAAPVTPTAAPVTPTAAPVTPTAAPVTPTAAPVTPTPETDADSDGFSVLAGDCNDNNSAIHPDAVEVCDGVDNDCDQTVDEGCTVDADGDGYTPEEGDCNDSDANIHPNAKEQCNGKDDDCDGTLDDGLSQNRFFRDSDNDGYGDPNNSVKACAAPPGYISLQGDCNDTRPEINPGAKEVCDGVDNNCDTAIDEGTLITVYRDADGDKYGNPKDTQLVCTVPTGWVLNPSDCNDGNAQVNPDAAEQCNGLDDNCNSQVDEGTLSTWYQDADQDAHGNPSVTTQACGRTDGYVASPADDCDDGNPAIHPDAVEVCDGVDNDCDQTVDEGVTTTFYRDADGDGYGTASSTTQACSLPSGYAVIAGDCNDGNVSINPDAIEACDGIDQDCNGQVDEGLPTRTYYRDGDGDGYGLTSATKPDCRVPTGYVQVSGDCNDADSSIHPGAAEVCNSIDDDCDGQTDEGLPTQTYYRDSDKDGYGLSTQAQVACSPPTGYVAVNGDCLDTDSKTFPGAAEKESATACMTDSDLDGYGATNPASGVSAGTDCVDSDKAISPAGTETCNGKDDNCNSLVDAAESGVTCTACEVGSDKTYKTIKDALRVSACKDILVYPGTYGPFSIPRAGPLSIRSTEGALSTVIDAESQTGINIQNIESRVIGNDVVLDGFTVKNGTGTPDPAGSSSRYGGGIYVGGGAAPTLKNLVVVSNSATYGGGIFIDGACTGCTQSPVLEDITVGQSGAGNTASVSGGGIYIWNFPSNRPLKLQGARIKIDANQVTANPSSGGGVRVTSSALLITAQRLELISNIAHNGHGGGLYATASTLQLQGVNLQVLGNHASQYSGGMGLDSASSLTMDATSSGMFQSNSTYTYDGGGLGLWNGSTATLNGLTFDKNTAGQYGGAIRTYKSPGDLSVNDCVFTGNKSNTHPYSTGYGGGAIYTDGGSLAIIDARFEGNVAGGYGSGGAVYTGGSVTLINSSFTSNTSNVGGAVYAGGAVTLSGTSFTSNSATGPGGAVYALGNVTLNSTAFTSNRASEGPGGAVYANGLFTASQLLVGNNKATQTSGGANPTCAGIYMKGGSIREALFWGNKAVNGQGGILCVEGSGAVLDSLVFSGNQVSSGQATAGSLLLKSGADNKVQNVTIAYTENLLGTINMAEIDNYSTGLNLVNNILLADWDYYLDYALKSTSNVTNVTNNVFSAYYAPCSGTTGGCGQDLTPSFVASTDGNNVCDEDYHLSGSNDPFMEDYGAYGTDSTWDEDLPENPTCP